MALVPLANHVQRQPLTTALRNICRDYPAGGTVLRELLQNADDAGATTVRFVLDEETYPVENLLDPHLQQYQGPAFLAFNNAIFKPEDFTNLSNLGDSLKLQDGLTTGKFGRGFNSVYNWTDSPSIVSGDHLLILDPHFSWSEGGPTYDYVENSGNIAIQNQMRAYQSVLENRDQRLEGTIIRVPLRTQDQARKSKISNRETSVPEIREVLQKFATEFGNSGLLFMRNVEKIGIEFGPGTSIRIEIVDCERIRSDKSMVKHAVKTSLENPDYYFNHSFEAEIEYQSVQESRRSKFFVHHLVYGVPVNSKLRDWAKEQNLVPWVAVAAQVPRAEKCQGSLSNVLPLPLVTTQPVHIHGLFSISPDRARLYQSSDSGNQDQSPALWNSWLFHDPIPMAWVKLLRYMAQKYPGQSAFEWWPRSLDDPHDLLTDALEMIIEIIDWGSLSLFPTGIGYVKATNGILATGQESTVLKEALQEAKIPIVYIPQRLRSRLEPLFNDRILSPRELCNFLKNVSRGIRGWGDLTKQIVLEYLLSEPGFSDYGVLELIPFEDGKYRSIAGHTAFLHRDPSERDLFHLEPHHNIDLNKISAQTHRVLEDGCIYSTTHPSIRHRSSSDFRDYCLSTVFKSVGVSEDMVLLDEEAVAFVSKSWAWIAQRQLSILDDALAGLWLLPLTNDCYRKIIPKSPFSEIIFAPVGELGDLLRQFDTQSSSKTPPLLNTAPTGLSLETLTFLMTPAKQNSRFLINDARNVVHLTQWLNKNATLVEGASNNDKALVVKLIRSNLPQHLPQLMRASIGNAIRALKIFKKVDWKVEGNKMVPSLTWTSLNSSTHSIGVASGMIPIPEIDGLQFLDAPWASFERSLLEILELAKCRGTVDIIEKHIIPAWKGEQAIKWAYSCKEQAASLLMRQYSLLSAVSQAELAKLSMVPVAAINGAVTSRFATAEELIDPFALDLTGLFFDDDEILPVATFYAEFHVALKGCGLKTALDESLVHRLVRRYASTSHPVVEIQQRAHRLVKSSCHWASRAGSKEYLPLRQLEWLPVVGLEGNLTLTAPDRCKGLRDRLLVSFQLPIFNIPISGEWEMRLGWMDKVSTPILLAQLSQGLDRQDRQIVDAVLRYVATSGATKELKNHLTKLPCVLTSSGLFLTPEKTFCRSKSFPLGCERLQPYLGNVDTKFWQDHKALLIELNIGKGPNTKDLLGVQSVLESKVPLSEADTAVAIEILNVASKITRTSLAGLKVLTRNGEFCPVAEINHHDLGLLTVVEKVNLTHPDIPLRTIQELGIELLSEKLIKGMLEIEDVDEEDEFDQREQVTTRISDTLDRYSVESTFREYLANADDTKGASRISWMLDERMHPCANLLIPQLKSFQGSALLVFNDGVFSEDDFKGFKNVGEGSKREDRATIGQFGRGSQTMYHWTDVPMILSGKFLLILDPQRESLWRNKHTGKRLPGAKLPLSKLKDACPDQLAPFEGLWGYTRDLDYFPGTIFRFPLRPETAQSKLRERKEPLVVSKLMEAYFHEARISLLFLRRINSIDFTIHGKDNLGWSISRQTLLDPNEDIKTFSDWVVCPFTYTVDSISKVTGKDKWWVAIEDLQPEAHLLPYSPRRVVKNIECGIAALVSSRFEGLNPGITAPKIMPPQMFSTLPLHIDSDLPVYIHATFSLSGDRQSIIFDEHAQQSQASAWNRHLLKNILPKLYLSFLDDVGSRVRQDVISFWPQQDPPKRSPSAILCSSLWNELPQSSKRLFPKAQLRLGLGQRQPAELFDINQAVFDFLPTNHSDALAPLLLSLGVKLVRNIPEEIVKHLKLLEEVNYVTGKMLRTLFKTETSRLLLQEEMSKNPNVLEALLNQAIPIGEDHTDLDGCCFLPLADGTLGTLRIINPTIQTTTYYMASANEIQLFDFASGLLFSTKTGRVFAKALTSGKFNLEKLQLCHVRKLLDKRPLQTIAQTTKWLTEFWAFWNKSLDPTVPLPNVDTDGLAIYQATRNGQETVLCIEISKLGQLPAVIEPSIQQHQRLCGKIPGLYRFNSLLMPNSLKESEISFSKSASFYRFINALRSLASVNRSKLDIFVKSHLDTADLKVLRTLLVYHTRTKMGPDTSELREFNKLKADLRSIPLWPSCNPTSSALMSANDCLIAGDQRFLVPWMKRYPQFIEHQFATSVENCMLNLGIPTIRIERLLSDYVLPLPTNLSGHNWPSYQTLIIAFSDLYRTSLEWRNIQDILIRQRVAVDKTGSLRQVRELFDHQNQMFMSAFRNEQGSKFLHDGIKIYRSLWIKLDLRHQENGYFRPADYLQCLQAINQRLAMDNRDGDANLTNDLLNVLAPLITPSSSIQRFGNSDWRDISQMATFLSQTNFSAEPEYRRVPMSTIASVQRQLSLSRIVSHEHVAVCWSQTAFATHQPTREVFDHISGHGKPRIATVWRHLEHMKNLAPNLKEGQVQSFLSDLCRTYTYLQDHLEESRSLFNLKTSAIWLNLNSSEEKSASLFEVKASWNMIEDLVLASSYDAGRIKAVRPFLMRYEKLLRVLGCNSIIHPTVTRPTHHHDHSVSTSLRKLRDEGKLLDVTYFTEGRFIKAHRVVLAAASEKCALQFSGRWQVEDVIKYDEQEDPENFLSYHALSTMINYAYDDKVNWAEMEVSASDDADATQAKLDMLLDLHKGADIWLIPELTSQVEDKILVAGKKFINIENVVAIQERAAEVRATRTEQLCIQYIEKNRAVVERANSGILP